MDTVISGVSDIDFTASVNDGCASLVVNFLSSSNARFLLLILVIVLTQLMKILSIHTNLKVISL